MKDELMQQIEVDCPICGKNHMIEKRIRDTQALFKDEVVDYQEIYYKCIESQEEEDEYVPAKIMDQNLLRVRDAYRKKHDLLTSKEIADIRNSYGLIQSEFAALLGWGEITVTRYESKTIQDETYDNLMRMVSENPLMALENLEKHKARFKEDRFDIIRKSILNRIDSSGNLYLKLQEIKSKYIRYNEPCDLNGYVSIDITKLGNVMAFFASNTQYLFKVKLMKLLWYADALHFKRHGRSMTGLVYEHMPYGALPIGFNEIIEIPTVTVVEELMYEDIAYRILPNATVSDALFSREEMDVLKMVADKFKDFKSKQIVDYMHEEIAYLETREHELIPYSKAKQLRELS